MGVVVPFPIRYALVLNMASESFAMMPWFPRDFMSSTRGWTLIQKAIYRELLDAQWDLGILPADPEELRALAGATPKQWSEAWVRVSTKFAVAEGGLQNERLELHRQKYADIRQSRAEAGRKGGLAKAMANASKCQPVAIANAVASAKQSSASIPSEEKKKEEEAAAPPFDASLFSEGKRVFGASSGGLLNKAISQKGKPFLLEMIERCRSKDPEAARAYLVRSMTPQERQFQP